MFLVCLQTMTKNRLHALLGRYPLIPQPKRGGLFEAAGRRWMRQIPISASDRPILDREVALLEHLQDQIRQADRLLKDAGRDDPRVARLQTIPGIGPQFAPLIVCEIDDVRRFAGPKKLHAYAGLVPSLHASGQRAWHGRLTKAGNKYLRWAMVEAVWPAIRADVGLRVYYERIARRRGANPAKVATARRLLTIVYRVLTEGREYRA
jgi:transposase